MKGVDIDLLLVGLTLQLIATACRSESHESREAAVKLLAAIAISLKKEGPK